VSQPVSTPKKVKQVSVIYNGRAEEFVYRADELVKALLEEAIRRFRITQNPHVLSLFSAAGEELPDEATLKQASVKVGDKLTLRPSAVKGG
jgi:hypothetical protein